MELIFFICCRSPPNNHCLFVNRLLTSHCWLLVPILEGCLIYGGTQCYWSMMMEYQKSSGKHWIILPGLDDSDLSRPGKTYPCIQVQVLTGTGHGFRFNGLVKPMVCITGTNPRVIHHPSFDVPHIHHASFEFIVCHVLSPVLVVLCLSPLCVI